MFFVLFFFSQNVRSYWNMQVKMENPKLSPNPEVNRLPGAVSFPDGFIESAPEEPLEEKVSDYKEEKLVELDSGPEVVIGNGCSSSSQLVENVADQSESAVAADDEAAPGEGNVKEKCNI